MSIDGVNISLNGTEQTLLTPTVSSALKALNLAADANHVAVAINETVVPRTRWNDVVIANGDRVEVITAVAGG